MYSVIYYVTVIIQLGSWAGRNRQSCWRRNSIIGEGSGEVYNCTLYALMLTCIDIYSNKILEQELEDLHIEEESLRYQIKLMQELYNIENDNWTFSIQLYPWWVLPIIIININTIYSSMITML